MDRINMFKSLLDQGQQFSSFGNQFNRKRYFLSFSRPLSDQEKCQNSISCLNVNETRREIVVNCKTAATRFFNYDHVNYSFENEGDSFVLVNYLQVFGFQTRQQDVYKTVVAPIVDEVLKGYSSTIFAQVDSISINFIFIRFLLVTVKLVLGMSISLK